MGKGVINVGFSDSFIYFVYLVIVFIGYGFIVYYNYKVYSDKMLFFYIFDLDIYGCILLDDVFDLLFYFVVVCWGGCFLFEKV